MVNLINPLMGYFAWIFYIGQLDFSCFIYTTQYWVSLHDFVFICLLEGSYVQLIFLSFIYATQYWVTLHGSITMLSPRKLIVLIITNWLL